MDICRYIWAIMPLVSFISYTHTHRYIASPLLAARYFISITADPGFDARYYTKSSELGMSIACNVEYDR